MRIAILGAGQLGGSFALALRKAGADITIAAYDSTPTHVAYLQQHGAVDTLSDTPAQAVADADIILLASPLRSYPALARAIAPAIKKNAIVTDVGSVKASMRPLKILLPTARIVPGHPIAGTEKSGPEAAQPELFRGRLCLLTPCDDADEAAVGAVETLWHLVGADVLRMPTEVHDQVYAQVSHLPHFIAFLTAGFLYRSGMRVEKADAMLQQFLRISRSSPRMWTDVALENREALLSAFATYTAVLAHVAGELKSGDAGTASPDAARTLLPRILASALISSVSLYEQQSGMSLRPFAGAGMRDIVAPAAQTPEGDIEAISAAAGSVAGLIEAMLPAFRQLESLIGAEDEAGLFRTLSSLADDAHALVAAKN